MKKVTIGVIREGKVPPDFRVPLSPKQCALVKEKFPHVDILVQTSPIRCFKDEEYQAEGITVQEDLSVCDILIGVKEVQINDLIPNKKYLFFSHTIKKQPYNRDLLKALLAKKIQMIDYEVLKNKVGKRLIGFGRYAGIVGCYNGFRGFGIKHGLYDLKPANQCENRIEMEGELKKVVLPANTKIVLTGFGRVGYGAREIMNLLPIMEVSPQEYLEQEFNEAVFTHLEADDYYARISDKGFDKKEFYTQPELYKSIFNDFAKTSDMYVACHFWSNKSPLILTNEDLKNDPRLKVVADVSCDIDGPVACTIRPSTIAQPFYGYDPQTGKETDYTDPKSVLVMAVDNLPCELPKDASEDFGSELINFIFPALLNEDPDDIIGRASETTPDGELGENFKYLEDYVNGVKA
ncbi:MAG: alanine dehydrogenase [Crocinitomicaceae bacterium]|jgi:alanine dehydrogenase|nr:alanine dehydrogenase [Crocinitomicaceae bacterium]